MYNVEEPYMYNLFEEPLIQNMAEVAPVFTTIVDQDNEEPVVCDLGQLFHSLIEGDCNQLYYTYVEPNTLNNYWEMMEESEVEEEVKSVYELESSYCIDQLFNSFTCCVKCDNIFVPQNTVETTDIEVNPYMVNLADLFASECEITVVEESEDNSIVAEQQFTYDLYATLIETEGCYFMSRSTINEPCSYDLDNLLPEVEIIDATVEAEEAHNEIALIQSDNEMNIISSFIQSEGHVMEANETCVRTEAKVDYFVPIYEEPLFTAEMFAEECEVEEEEKLNLSNDSWDELEEEYEQADNTEEPYIERVELDEEEDCKTDAVFSIATFQEAFKAKFDDIKAP